VEGEEPLEGTFLGTKPGSAPDRKESGNRGHLERERGEETRVHASGAGPSEENMKDLRGDAGQSRSLTGGSEPSERPERNKKILISGDRRINLSARGIPLLTPAKKRGTKGLSKIPSLSRHRGGILSINRRVPRATRQCSRPVGNLGPLNVEPALAWGGGTGLSGHGCSPGGKRLFSGRGGVMPGSPFHVPAQGIKKKMHLFRLYSPGEGEGRSRRGCLLILDPRPEKGQSGESKLKTRRMRKIEKNRGQRGMFRGRKERIHAKSATSAGGIKARPKSARALK